MDRYTVSQNARCPYYRSEQRKENYKLRCQGPMPGTWLHMVFADRAELLKWRDERCKGCWRECPVARMLEMK